MFAPFALLAVLAQADPLAADFQRWFRGDLSRDGERATRVLNRLRARGRVGDGRRLLKVIERTPGSGGERRVIEGLLRNLASARTALGVQIAFHEWVEAGKVVQTRDGEPEAWGHREPATAARVLPLLGSFHRRRFRLVLERFARGREPELALAAADGLRRTHTEAALRSLCALLARENDPARLRTIVGWMREVVSARGKRLQAPTRDLVSTVVARRMRRSDGLAAKRALLPLLHALRVRSSVPVLVEELEDAFARYRKPRKPVPVDIAFWITDVHDALRDLTGFTTAPSTPEVWRDFWEREEQRFEVWPVERAAAARRRPTEGFFGIRVRGRRVLFLLDASPSMRREMQGKDKAARFARGKAEILDALGRLEPDVEFNVIVFSDEVLRFARTPVRAEPWRLKKVRTWLANARTGTQTRLLDALQSGLDGAVFRTHNAFRRSLDEAFVVSDGLPRQKPHRIHRAVAEWNAGRSCRLHAVCLGPGDGGERRATPYPTGGGPGIDFLRRLAEDNGGEFRIVQ